MYCFSFFAYMLPVMFNSYLFSVYFRTNYRTCGLAVQHPLFTPLRQNIFLQKLTLNSPATMLWVTLCVFTPAHYDFALNIVSLLALSSRAQSPIHLFLSFSQINSIAQVLLSGANVTRTHYIKDVKSFHCFKIHILCRDHASWEIPLQIQKDIFRSQSWLKMLPLSFFY